MDKNLTLEHLNKAIYAYNKWVESIKLLVAGEPIKADEIEPNAVESGFGSWFYEEGQKLSAIKTIPADSMELIASLHTKAHDVYLNIYKVYFDIEKKSLIKRLISRKKKISPEEQEIAQTHLEELEGITNDLLIELDRLERRTSAFPENDFEML